MRVVCIEEPISWLRLERFRLGELSEPESRAIQEHLQHCPACQSCYAETAVEIALAPLPELSEFNQTSTARPATLSFSRTLSSWLRGWRAAAIGLTGATCALLLWIFNPPRSIEPHEPRPAIMRVKGGTLALQLVRQRGNVQSKEQRSYRPGDRFKLLVTSPPELGPTFKVVVYQNQRAYFPIALSQPPAYGNSVPLPGAIALDGDAAAEICVAFGESDALARQRLAQGPKMLPQNAVCIRVVPEAADTEIRKDPHQSDASTGCTMLFRHHVARLLRTRAKITSQNSCPDLGRIRPLRVSKTAELAPLIRGFCDPRSGQRRPENGMRKCEVVSARVLTLLE